MDRISLRIGLFFALFGVAGHGLSQGIGGAYDDGQFTLPELANALEHYEIEMSRQGGPGTVLSLPPGVSSIRLSKSAKPPAGFSWSFRRIDEKGRLLETYTPATRSLRLISPGPNEVVAPRNPLRVTWDALPGKVDYVVSFKDKDALGEPTKQEGRAVPGGPPFAYLRDLIAGKTYSWQVTAVRDSAPVAVSEPREFTLRSSWYTAAKDAGLSLQRAYTLIDSDKKAEAASIGYTRQAGQPNAYNTEFALIYQAPGDKGEKWWALTYGASLESRTHSSGNAKGSDATRLRLSADWDASLRPGAALYASLAGKYETDRSKSTEKILAELLFTPTFASIGRYWPEPQRDYTGRAYEASKPWARFMWRPYLGVDVGDNRKVGSSAEVKGHVERWNARLHLDVQLPRFAEAVQVNSVTLFADGVIRKLPREDTRPSYRFISSGADFGLTDHLAITFRYNVGRDAPKFSWDRTAAVGLGASF